MPDTLTPAQPTEGATPEQVFAHFQTADPGNAQPVVTEPTTTEPVKAPDQPSPTSSGSTTDIPEQFLTGKKAEQQPQEDEYEQLMKTEPQGQLKHDDWKRYKAAVGKKVDALTKQLQERETKLAEAEKRGVPEEISKKLEQYEKTLAEREAIIRRVAVQESDEYKREFSSKESDISELLKQTATELGLDSDALIQALKSSPKRRQEIMDQMELGDTARYSLTGLMSQYDLLQRGKEKYLADANNHYAKHQQEQQQALVAQEKQRSEFEDQIFSKTVQEMRQSFAPFQRVEGNDAWNAQAEALEAEAKKYFNSAELPLEDLSRVILKGVGAIAQERIVAALHKKLSDATAELASLKRAQPGSAGHVPHSNGTPDDSNLTPEQRRMNTWNRFVTGQ